MRENDLKELEQLHAELAEYVSEIQSLNDEIIELKIELQRVINQAGHISCDED